MRPAISRWFDSSIRIWRPTSFNDALAVEEREYTAIETVGAVINRSVTSTNEQSGGMADVGRIRWYGVPTLEIRRRDVCEVIAGPDAGHTWEVDADPVHPRGHHTQVDCVEWHGVLPTEDQS